MEWKSSVWGEGAHMGNTCLCLCGQQRMRMSVGFQLESPYRLSSQVAFLLRGQPGMECGRWGGKRAHSLLPLPGLPSCACDIQENAQEPKTSLFLLCCIKAAVRSRLISDLCRFSSFFSVKHILFLEFWQVFIIIFFQVFCVIVLVLYVQTVRSSFLSKPNRCTLAEWLHLPRVIPDLQLFKISLLASLTFLSHFLGNENESVGSSGCRLFVPPSSSSA